MMFRYNVGDVVYVGDKSSNKVYKGEIKGFIKNPAELIDNVIVFFPTLNIQSIFNINEIHIDEESASKNLL